VCSRHGVSTLSEARIDRKASGSILTFRRNTGIRS
jgi:hypothetical protein